MGRWDPYSRRELRSRRRAWLRNNAGVIAWAVPAVLAITAIETWGLATLFHGPVEWYLIGVTHVAILGGTLHVFSGLFLASDRQASHHVRGAWGEDNTRDELRRAKRRRLLWDWVDSIDLQFGDVDHLVVTRRGGLLAIDSKWRSDLTRAETLAMARSAQTAGRRAEALARTVLPKERGTHRARTQSFSVMPVAVVWGAAQGTVPEDAVVEGVRFLAGRKLLPWLRTLDGQEVSRQAAGDLADRLRDFRATARSAVDERRRVAVRSSARAAAPGHRTDQPGQGSSATFGSHVSRPPAKVKE